MAYDVNDGETVTFTYRTAAGVLTDPTVTTATVTQPDGTSTTYTAGVGPELVHDSTGVYHINVIFTTPGTWVVEGHGTGAVTAAITSSFEVGVIHAYTDVATFSDWLGPTAAANAAQKQRAIASASRAIDAYCHRRFWLDPAPVARTYSISMSAALDGVLLLDDIGDLTGVIVEADTAGDGTFDLTWLTTDYEFTPTNAPYASPEAEPWTGIVAVGAQSFPFAPGGFPRRQGRLRITARWGWPQVPETVEHATLIKAAQLFHRKNSPQGVITFDELGAIRVASAEDSDVRKLLAAYRLPVLA